jgi:hypothetical protein
MKDQITAVREAPLRPMSDFDPSRPAMVHDRLNDKTFEWKAEWAANYREQAIGDSANEGVVGWDGLLLDGWTEK